MHILSHVRLLACLFLTLIGLQSCNDQFDSHYQVDESIVSNASLMETLESQADLSIFVSFLKQTGYDQILSSDQSYTVWAPTNSALQQVDASNRDLVLKIVKNHVARFVNSASGALNEIIYMENGKKLSFQQLGDDYFLHGKKLTTKNLAAKNGIVHVIADLVPVIPSIWEHLMEPEMDSIRNFLYAFDIREFVRSSSTVIDYENGMPVYDSIFYESNIIWNTRYERGIGYLGNEDSLYTMILPTNTAWEEAYRRISPYFASNVLENPDSLQRINTQYAIVQDLVFRGRLDNPATLGVTDSLLSTRQGVFYDPSYLFAGTRTEKVEASNGVVYRTDRLTHHAWESWQRPIQVEAEAPFGRTLPPSTTATSYTRYLLDNPHISNSGCLDVQARGSQYPFASFEIPNTLAGAYDIYCVFVPMSEIYPGNRTERTRIRYDIQQVDRTSLQPDKTRWKWSSLIGAPATGIAPAENTTDTVQITKMLLRENFTFPYANVKEEYNTIQLKIYSRVTTAETREGYRNNMAIDYLLLEPVR
ncbi:MAG: fasciclin domain-containing protein [Dysgonamonadaceae bacterium]|nr:fasciclin domain-containing protein [Dysgonamonadaceae bacterium]